MKLASAGRIIARLDALVLEAEEELVDMEKVNHRAQNTVETARQNLGSSCLGVKDLPKKYTEDCAYSDQDDWDSHAENAWEASSTPGGPNSDDEEQ